MQPPSTLILNATVVNEGQLQQYDVLLQHGRISRLEADLQHIRAEHIIDATGLHLFPGMIDDQVHFREPGLTGKGDIATESAAAVAGGITSYMDMPNVQPATVTNQALADKQQLARQKSLANYAFYLGATNHNIDEIKAVDSSSVCGIKVFMGASTGNLLVNEPAALEQIFRESPILIATHCEDNDVITRNTGLARQQYGEQVPVTAHPVIRSSEACYLSSSYAVELARRFNSNLHVLHITTARELSLFEPGPLANKRITAEACVHHLWFSDQDYPVLQNQIKCNPAIKTAADRTALLAAIADGRIDIIATDHAPHTLAEKQLPYLQAPAGLPLVQHPLLMLLELHHRQQLTLPLIARKTAHNPAIRYNIQQRGFIREGYFADLVLADLQQTTTVTPQSIRYKCGWSPLAGQQFHAAIAATFVNGYQVFNGQQVLPNPFAAQPLFFCR
ncbi:dihydroorotase [Chromatiaceae bacterium AAb-1]|nr:dihydroorotase [Chromatiaceae bacterium AAb-1]